MKSLFFIIILLIIVIPASADTIYVDDSGGSNYTTIGDAVDNANDSDTIIIRDGAYTESVVVNKRLTINSENGSSAVTVTADSDEHTFSITSDYVNISELTITGATGGVSTLMGVVIYFGNDNCNISDNNITGNDVGIYVNANNTIINNNTILDHVQYGIHLILNNSTVTNNTIEDTNIWSIYMSSATNTTVSDNNISSNSRGIYLSSSNDNNITNNIVSSSSLWGVYLTSSDNNIIMSNNITDNNYGIYLLTNNDDNTVYNNYFDNTNNAYDDGTNIWNTTKVLGTNIIGKEYLGGNYWSDYTGIDTTGDKLGDNSIPYTSGGSNDYLPLVYNTYPPAPTNLANTSDNFYVNYTWDVGSGVDTDSYNITISINGTEINHYNSTTDTYNNTTVTAHDSVEIWVYSYNDTCGLSYTSLNDNVTLSNNQPYIADLMTENTTNPTQITASTPFFNWTFNDNDSDIQTQWEIEVGSTEGNNDLWDTGLLNGADINDIYAGSTLSRGTTYYLRVRVNDSYELSEWVAGTFKANSLPVLTNVSLSPGSPTTDDNLTVSNDTVSDDDDDAISFHYQWYINDTLNSTFNDLSEIDSDYTSAGEIWKVYVIPNDTLENGTGQYSNEVQIASGNTAPTLPTGLSPTGSQALSSTSLSWTASTDAENDTITYEYQLEQATSDFEAPYYTSGNTTAIITDAINVPIGYTYYYRVRACDDVLCSAYSAIASFTTTSPGGGGGGGGGSQVINVTQLEIDPPIVDQFFLYFPFYKDTKTMYFRSLIDIDLVSCDTSNGFKCIVGESKRSVIVTYTITEEPPFMELVEGNVTIVNEEASVAIVPIYMRIINLGGYLSTPSIPFVDIDIMNIFFVLDDRYIVGIRYWLLGIIFILFARHIFKIMFGRDVIVKERWRI